MKRRFACIAILAMAVGCAHSHKNHEEEDEGNEVKMNIDAIPEAARQTIMREAQGATVATVDQEQKHGKTIYEADAKINGQNWEINVDANGKLVSKKIDNDND